MNTSYSIQDKKPFDYSVITTLVLALILPISIVGGFSAFIHFKVAYADFNEDVLIPEEDQLVQTYKENLEYTKMVTESNRNKAKDSDTTPKTVTTSAPTVAPGQSKILPVPLIDQIHTLSCEVASVEMILEYFGNSSQNQDLLMIQLGYADPIQPYFENGTMIWGDPDVGFVGSVTGFMVHDTLGLRGATGWGIRKGPVANLLKKYHPNSYAGTGSIESLVQNLNNDRPVIFWHVRDDAFTGSMTYQTPEGKLVELKQYHVALIVGYKVDQVGNKTFVVNDPDFGVYEIDQTNLDRIWAKHDYDMVVGVR